MASASLLLIAGWHRPFKLVAYKQVKLLSEILVRQTCQWEKADAGAIIGFAEGSRGSFMLEPGTSYKVKVELSPGKVGYGRATILERTGSRTFMQLRTAKEPNYILPHGSRVWFVADSPSSTLQGLWSSCVVGSKLVGGKTVVECGPVKFEPLVQQRKSARVPLQCAVDLVERKLPYAVRSRNISRSGIGLEAYSQYVDEFPVGENVEIVLTAPGGKVQITCRVIRSEYNWLNNRTAIGLEFVTMTQDAVELLEKLRNQASGSEPGEGVPGMSTTLAGSLRTTRENLKLTKPLPGVEEGQEIIGELAESDDDLEDSKE